LDNKSTMVIYMVLTINKLTVMNKNSQLKKILNVQKCYLLRKNLKSMKLNN
jgi:hypothetical protein